MVKLNKIYTKTGDGGCTGLADGSRVKKHDARPSAYGTVDELNSILGIVLEIIQNESTKNIKVIDLLKKIQNDLFDLGADLSTPKKENEKKVLRIIDKQITNLENEIDQYNKNLLPLKSFILPGGSKVSSWFHLARTIARRAEREVSYLSVNENINNLTLIYLNRLSDLFFVIGRVFNNKGKNDVLWIPGKNH